MAKRILWMIFCYLVTPSCTTIRKKIDLSPDKTFEAPLGYHIQPDVGFPAFLQRPLAKQMPQKFIETRVPVEAGREYLVGSYHGEVKFSKLANKKLKDINKLPVLMRYDLWTGTEDFSNWQGARSNDKNELSEIDMLSAVALNPGKFQTIESIGKSGIKVPFVSTDIGAMLAWYQYQQGKTPQVVAGRCEKGYYISKSALDQNLATGRLNRMHYGTEMERIRKSFECRGIMDATLFHYAITFHLGELGKPLIMERDNRLAIIRGFELTTKKEASGYTSAKMILNVVSFRGEFNQEYNYRMELNSKGVLTQAVWVDGNSPDVIWKPEETVIEGPLAGVFDLAKESREAKELKDSKDIKDQKETKDQKDPKISSEAKNAAEPKPLSSSNESEASQQARESIQSNEPKATVDGKTSKDLKTSKVGNKRKAKSSANKKSK